MLFAFSSRPPRTFTRALPLHEAIIEAVQSHDPDAAEAAALRLLDDTAKNIKRALHEVSRLQASSSADGRRRVRDGSRT
jgi:DNA-binding FadR family transcriptional regulator